MFEYHDTALPGCLRIVPPRSADLRGRFVKVLHADAFRARGLETHFAEEFYTVSGSRVLRGLHFQVPPHDHVKLVYCVVGQVLDVAVDLRRGSPTYGRSAMIELSAENEQMLYIPRGFAHGFLVTSPEAILVYKVGTVHSPQHDRGVRWDSAGINWPEGAKVISDRDLGLPPLGEFQTPFRFSAPDFGGGVGP